MNFFTHSIPRFLLLSLLALTAPLVIAEDPDETQSSQEVSTEIELPPLSLDLSNLWDGSWHQEVSSRLGEPAQSDMSQWIGEAIREHRNAFSSLEPGARVTQILNMESALSLRADTVHNSDGITGRLSKRIVPLYRRLHQNLMDEHFVAALSIDAIQTDSVGENLLSGDLLIDVIAYVVQIERMSEPAAIDRTKEMVSAKVDHFVRWIRQRREPDRIATGLIWTDWKETDAAYYSEPDPEEPAIQAVYNSLSDWYFTEYLPSVALEIDEAIQASDPVDISGLDPEVIAIVEFLADRPLYEEAFISWLSANEKPLAALGIVPSEKEHVHAALGVDEISGKPLSPAHDKRTAFLKTALYRKFQDALTEFSGARTRSVQSKIKSLSQPQREQLKAMEFLF